MDIGKVIIHISEDWLNEVGKKRERKKITKHLLNLLKFTCITLKCCIQHFIDC